MNTTTVYLLYFVFTLGGAGVYFLLPRGDRSKMAVGAVFGVSALAALLIVLATRIVPADSERAYFYLFSVIALAAATRVITHPRPVYSALYFVLVVLAVAALLVLQQAEFVAIALVIIYAGAILVTYLFVIMLAQQSGSPAYDRRAREPLAAVLCGFVLMAAIAGRAGDLPSPAAATTVQVSQDASPLQESAAPAGNTMQLGALVMTRYVVALEAAGVLLLVSMVGAIALSRKKVPSEGYRTPRKPLGQVGREAAPF